MTITAFQLATPFITTLIQLALALFLYRIKDYDPVTRGYERYTKRLQFHKAEHELRAIAKVETTEEDLKRYRHSLQNSARWISESRTLASRISKWIAWLTTSFLMPYVAGAVFPAYLNSFAGQNQILQNIAFSICFIVFLVVSYKIYVGMRAALTRELLSLSRIHKRLAHLGEIVDD